jgi:hypothetical protein
MRAARLSVANYNATLSSDSLESGTGSSNSLRFANQSPHLPTFLERAENSTRNAGFFLPATHRERATSRRIRPIRRAFSPCEIRRAV